MESVVIVTTQVDRSYLLALLIDDIEFWGVMPHPPDTSGYSETPPGAFKKRLTSGNEFRRHRAGNHLARILGRTEGNERHAKQRTQHFWFGKSAQVLCVWLCVCMQPLSRLALSTRQASPAG